MTKNWTNHLPDHTDSNPLILYQGRRSADGYAAALAAWIFFQGRGDYLAMDYGNPIPDVSARTVYVLGFSLSAKSLQDIERKANQVVMLDHHHSSVHEMWDVSLSKGFVHLDINKSAARLAWEYFHPEHLTPALIRFVEDRELLRWSYPETPAFMAHLDIEEMNFHRWSSVLDLQGREFNEYVQNGETMHSKFMHIAEILSLDAKPVLIDGAPGLMAEAPNMFHGAVGEILSKKCHTFALLWSIDGNHLKIGLHSQVGYNTLPISQSMGGAGNERSSVFHLHIGAIGDLLFGNLDLDRLKSLRKGASSSAGSPNLNANKALFHGMWSAAAFSSRYDKIAWKSVHRQLLAAKLID